MSIYANRSIYNTVDKTQLVLYAPVMSKLKFSGRKLRYARTQLGLSHRKLGLLLDRTRITVYNWETSRSRPNADDMPMLSKALKQPMGFFYEVRGRSDA
jgi:transcriptional regulator with XRE-family HTH domain